MRHAERYTDSHARSYQVSSLLTPSFASHQCWNRFVVSYSIVLTPSKFESIYLWSTIPRSLVSIHLAWLAGEKNKMKTWQKNGLIAFNSTTLECVPEKREKGWHKAWQGKKLEKVVSGIEAIVIASES